MIMLMAPPSRMEVKRTVKAAPAQVWDLLVDTARWPEWGPSVRTVDCPDRWIRLGSSGKVLTALGFWLPFLVTELDEGKYWAWSVAGIRATGHRLDVLGRDLCRLAFEIPLWAIPYAPVCTIALRRIAGILEGSRDPARRDRS